MMPLMGAAQTQRVSQDSRSIWPELFPSRPAQHRLSHFAIISAVFAAAAGSMYSAELSKFFAKSYQPPLPIPVFRDDHVA